MSTPDGADTELPRYPAHRLAPTRRQCRCPDITRELLVIHRTALTKALSLIACGAAFVFYKG